MARIQNRVVSSLPDLFYLICDIMQSITIWLFLPSHQNPVDKPQTGLRIAVVGAGLTGVSAAAHCIENGADVVLLEAASKDKLGGIWARVNSTSTLQIHSLMYRFHPTVRWRQRYPNQGQILDQIRMLWSRFNLPDRTRFSTPVQSIKRHPDGGWIINNDSETLGVFDGVIASTGTCGQPMMPPIEREALFDGHICHSSELDQVDAAGKNVVIVGGGASAVEAVEFAVEKGANQIDIVSRSTKWVIPRGLTVGTALASWPCGSFLPELYLRHFVYRDYKFLAPEAKPFYSETPICNSQILEEVRTGRVRWLKGSLVESSNTGVLAKFEPGQKHSLMNVDADIIVKATGFERPTLYFLPANTCKEPYLPPSWFLGAFPPSSPDICAINCTYLNGIGTVGHWHIGVYARLMMVFLMHPETLPTRGWMESWIRTVGWIKGLQIQDALSFFTYGELILWFASCLVRPTMWSWAFFVLTGLGRGLGSSSSRNPRPNLDC